MNKLKMHSPDLTQGNIDKLAELFPNCVAEAADANGVVKRSIDFDQLRQELSSSIVEGPQERYSINWPGKREALLTANAPIAKTLRPCREESVDFDTTQNLFIEGDNLDALKLLQETYLNKVKMIYVDPPYNTGSDFVYDDDFSLSTSDFLERSNQKDAAGQRLNANTESNGRFHSDWLTMLYARLKVARNLLAEDGLLFVSIDDVEMVNLCKLCEEVFGAGSFVGNFIWKSRQTTDSRKQTRVSTDHEYVVCFAKNIECVKFLGKDIDTDKYQNPDNDSRGPWASIDLTVQETKETRPNHFYAIRNPQTGMEYPANPRRVWSKGKAVVDAMIAEGRVLFPSDPGGRPREKKFLNEMDSTKTGFSSILDSGQVGFTRDGTKAFASHFDEKYFTFPKSLGLLKTLVEQAVTEKSLVIDLFAGSSSMAEAIFEYNATSGAGVRCISIQIDEECLPSSTAYLAGYKSIAELGKERIRRAGKKLKLDHAGKAGVDKLDVGFRVLKIDSSNMKEVFYTPDAVAQDQLFDQVNNIREDRTSEDLLFQVLLDWGVDLALPIAKENIEGKSVYFVDGNALAACFDEGVSEEFVKLLAKRGPLRAVFRDAGFATDSVKINVEQIFKLMSPSTDVKTI